MRGDDVDIKNLEIGFLSGFIGTLIIGLFSASHISGVNIIVVLSYYILYSLLVGAFGLLLAYFVDNFKIYHAMIAGFVGVALINTYYYSTNLFSAMGDFNFAVVNQYLSAIFISGIEGLAFAAISYLILNWVIKRR